MKGKRSVCLLMALLPVMTAVLGCGGHKHAAVDGWQRDAREHWRLCECGERLQVAAHQPAEGVCDLCCSEIRAVGGEIHVSDSDAWGNPLRLSRYDASTGRLLEELVRTYEYAEDGSIRREEVFADGFRILESEYDENGDLVLSRSYEPEAGLTLEGKYEYAVGSDGVRYRVGATEYIPEAEATYACRYDQYGELTDRVKYDAADQVVFTEQYQREYGPDGQKLWEKTYVNGVLTYEAADYILVTEAAGSQSVPGKTIEYYEDGARLVSVFGENGKVAEESYILPDETVARQLRYEYQTDINGNQNYARVYEGDRLITESRYATTADGRNYCTTLLEYRKDGSRREFRYDENETLIEEIKYDTNGQRIP